jgi:hypothetical protein
LEFAISTWPKPFAATWKTVTVPISVKVQHGRKMNGPLSMTIPPTLLRPTKKEKEMATFELKMLEMAMLEMAMLEMAMLEMVMHLLKRLRLKWFPLKRFLLKRLVVVVVVATCTILQVVTLSTIITNLLLTVKAAMPCRFFQTAMAFRILSSLQREMEEDLRHT